MSNFYGKRFLSSLVGALAVLGSLVASARDDKLGKGNLKGRGGSSASSDKNNGKLGKLRSNREVKSVDGLKKVLKETGGKVVRVSPDGKGGFVAFVKTPAGKVVTVAIVGVPLLVVLGLVARYVFSGGEKTDGSVQVLNMKPEERLNVQVLNVKTKERLNVQVLNVKTKEDLSDQDLNVKPEENLKDEVLPVRPGCFDGLFTNEKERCGKAISSFGLNCNSGSFADFVTSGKKIPGDGKFNSMWGSFFVKQGGRIRVLGKDGLSDAVLSIGMWELSMSDLSERVFSLFGDDVKSISGIFAHFLTVCWVYAKHADKVFYIGKSNGEYGYYVNEDMFKDETFKSEVISTYNEIKKWVVSCRNEKA